MYIKHECSNSVNTNMDNGILFHFLEPWIDFYILSKYKKSRNF